jgi:hypothetical protein
MLSRATNSHNSMLASLSAARSVRLEN